LFLLPLVRAKPLLCSLFSLLQRACDLFLWLLSPGFSSFLSLGLVLVAESHLICSSFALFRVLRGATPVHRVPHGFPLPLVLLVLSLTEFLCPRREFAASRIFIACHHLPPLHQPILKPLACIWFGLSGVSLAATGAPSPALCFSLNIVITSTFLYSADSFAAPIFICSQISVSAFCFGWLCDPLFLPWLGFLFGPVLFSSSHHSGLCFLRSVPTEFWRWLLCSCYA
jgi:hypothetical protein